MWSWIIYDCSNDKPLREQLRRIAKWICNTLTFTVPSFSTNRTGWCTNAQKFALSVINLLMCFSLKKNKIHQGRPVLCYSYLPSFYSFWLIHIRVSKLEPSRSSLTKWFTPHILNIHPFLLSYQTVKNDRDSLLGLYEFFCFLFPSK